MSKVNVMELNGEQIEEDIGSIIKDACEIVIWQHSDNEMIEDKNIQVNVYLLTDDEIKEINNLHRKIDEPTDVLSFLLNVDDPYSGEHILGEILISKETAKKQAEQIGHSFERETAFLCVHGTLHLLGYDHENDEKRMIEYQKIAIELIQRDVLEQDKMIKRIIKNLGTKKENAYAPYSGIFVSAAAVADNGRIFYGVNVENSSYGATACAERNAIANAVASGILQLRMIALASNLDDYIYPCGICRQVILEFALPWTKIVVSRPDGEYIIYRLDELIPHGFEIKKRGIK